MQQLLRKVTGLSAIFLSMVLHTQCDKPETQIGKEIQSDEDQIGFFTTDTVSFNFKTKVADSLRVDELSQNVFGALQDAQTGSFKASIATHIRISTADVDFGDEANIVVDSLILSLVYSGSYGDTNYLLPIEVYELDQVIELDSAYYSNDNFTSLSENLVADGFVTPEHRPSLPLILGGDTLTPMVRIPLKNSLAQRFIDNSGQSALQDNDQFIEFFKGLYITTPATPAIGEGLALYFNLLHIDTKVTMYYRDQTAQDTVAFDFLINGNSARITDYTLDPSGSIASNYLMDTTLQDFGFIQSAGGMRTEVSFPYLQNLKDSLGDFSINEAILILPVAEGTEVDPTSPHSNIFITTLNEEGNEVILPDQLEGSTFFGGTYNEDEKQYEIRITRWLQQVLYGSRPQNDLRIIASLSGVTANRTVLQGFGISSTKPKLSLKISKF